MKKLFLSIILISFISCKAQLIDPVIPSNYIGEWVNASGNDIVVITATTIRWNSNEPHAETSFVDKVTNKTDTFFVFESYPNVYRISIEKVSRNKLRLHCQTLYDGLERCRDEYLKQVRISN